MRADATNVTAAAGDGLVSVIIPSFNRAPVLERAVESALQQTYPHTEIVVVDDGSTDDTRSRLAQIRSPKVKVVETPQNIGPARARNLGIAHSTGSYVSFLDSDDTWEPWKLAEQVACFEHGSSDLGAVYCGRRVHLEDGHELEIQPHHRGEIFTSLLRRNTVPLPTLMVRRAVLDDIGVFDPDLPACEDWDLVLRIAERYTCDYVAAPAVVYEGTGTDRMSARTRSVFIANHRIFRRFGGRPPGRSVLSAYLALQSRELLNLGRFSLARRYALRSLRFGIDTDERLALRTLRQLMMRRRMGRLLVQIYAWRKPRAGGRDAGAQPRARRMVEALRDTALGYWQWLHAEAESAWPTRHAPAADAMPHALVVATSLPPRFDGGVFRPLSWLQYAGENGWRISALTRAPSGEETDAGRQLAAQIPPDVTLCHAPASALRPSWRIFQQVDGGFLTALALYRTGVDAFASAPPTAVIATGPNFAAFVAGFLLSRRFGVRLVLDYRDEWNENPFGFIQQGRDDRRWERRCLNAANAVLFTTDSQLRHADTAFPGLIGDKGAVLLNGWEPDTSAETMKPELQADNRLTVAFSGVLGSMGSPTPFLRDLTQVLETDPKLKAKLRLRFIGRRLAAAEEALARFPHPEIVELIDQCPRAEADRLIRQSDALLLLSSAEMARYLQGKLFEYLAAGKPILVHGHPGEGPSLVAELDAGLYVEDGDTEALSQALGTLLGTPATAWSTKARQDWANDHTRRRMARALFERLSTLTAADSTKAPPR